MGLAVPQDRFSGHPIADGTCSRGDGAAPAEPVQAMGDHAAVLHGRTARDGTRCQSSARPGVGNDCADDAGAEGED